MAPYFGLYLKEQKFSLLEIAQLASLLMMTKIIAPLLWGSIADKYHNSVLLVRVGAFMTLLSFLGFFFASTFWQYAFVIIAFSFFWNAILPQIEVITLFNLAGQQDRYGRVRLWGSVGFIFAVVFMGILFEKIGISSFPLVLLLITFFIWLTSLFRFHDPKYRAIKKNESSQRINQSFIKLLRDKNVTIFFIVCFLLQVSHGAYYTYFSIYLESLGYTKNSIGGLWGFGVIAEVIIFVVMHHWFERQNIKSIMFIALCLTAIRWYFTAQFANVFVILVFLQCLHAFSFGAMHSAAIKFVHQVFESNNQGKAQALYSSAGFGAGGAVGAYSSGILVTNFSYEAAFIGSAIVILFALILVVFMNNKTLRNNYFPQ